MAVKDYGSTSYLGGVFWAVLGLAIAVGGPSSGATDPKAAQSRAKSAQLQGVWMGLSAAEGADPRYKGTAWSPKPETVFTPWGAGESKRMASPITPGECDPFSPPMMMSDGGLYPIQISQFGDNLVFIYETKAEIRRIYLDGRPHAPDLYPTWTGDSIGHWDGDVLIIDTIGMNGKWRPLNGYVAGGVYSTRVEETPRQPLSDQTHMVERIRLLEHGQIFEDEITLDDPKTYTKPFTRKVYWQARPDISQLEYFCSDNQRPDAEGQFSPEAKTSGPPQ